MTEITTEDLHIALKKEDDALTDIRVRLTNIEAILEELLEGQQEQTESIANLSLPGGRFGIVEYGD